MRRRIGLAAALIVGLIVTVAPGLAAQTSDTAPTNCGTYEGVACSGWFSDNAGVVADDQRIDDAIGALVTRYGHQIAVVTVDRTPRGSPLEFARDLGNAWGVGDPTRNDGIVVLIDLGNRRTEITTGPGVPGLDYSRVTGAGNSYFGRGDFEGGILAIVGSLEQELANPSGGNGIPGKLIAGALAAVALVGGGVALAAARRRHHEAVQHQRAELIDGDVARLEPSGQELPLLTDYSLPPPDQVAAATTAQVLAVLREISEARTPPDSTALTAAWSRRLLVVLDADRLATESEIPLDLRASTERPLLEGALQTAIGDALEVDPGDEATFAVRRQELNRIIDSLRPHRVAAARFRLARSIIDRLVTTAIGATLLTDEGERFLQSGPVLVPNAPVDETLDEMTAVYATARDKADKLERLYDQLPFSTTRPAVAAALADLSDDTDSSYGRYETVRISLEERGDMLSRDGLSIPAIAALLLMNNDDEDVDDFISAYAQNRSRGTEPDAAVEYALAGLSTPGEIARIRKESRRLGIPVALTAALLRSRDDGPEVFNRLADELAAGGIKGDNRRTIAAVLAVALEPAQAIRRWKEARAALAALGLVGAYADVAAAFGASDPRGPRTFALAYAAQRQALARSSIDDADRFAPELAHDGTSGQKDSWSQSPIPRGIGTFDPYTLLFYHWVITKGNRGSYGWEPTYRDRSWSQDSGSWWGGGGGFAGGGGSSWGGSWDGGSFGGFGGGGGFSGGGGSSW